MWRPVGAVSFLLFECVTYRKPIYVMVPATCLVMISYKENKLHRLTKNLLAQSFQLKILSLISTDFSYLSRLTVVKPYVKSSKINRSCVKCSVGLMFVTIVKLKHLSQSATGRGPFFVYFLLLY